MKKLLLFLTVFSSLTFFSQTKKAAPTKAKLVVGIVVDQMRNDYLYRYWDRYSNGGFKRLLNEGYQFKNAHYNYIPTYTGPGHSSIYTGATPRVHGIIANDWYVKSNNTWKSCVKDTNVKSVGAPGKGGQASPHAQLSTTIGDELKLSTSKLGKVFAVAIKDRSAIFPAGHTADGAFWFDDASGNFVSSSWYMNELPQWVKNFNDKKTVKTYLEKGWNTLYPLATYTNSVPDENRYESAPFKDKAVFPYDFKYQLEKNQLGIIKATPYGSSVTKDLAIECLRNESLGKDEVPDLLSISFSSPDIIGHAFGPRSVEIEDVYLRLDKDIEEILNALDKEVGKNNYIVFLTADHGGGDVPNYLIDNKINAGLVPEKQLRKDLKEFFRTNYGDTLLLANLSNEQVFLNEPKLYGMNLNKEEVEERLCKFLVNYKGIAEAYPSQVLKYQAFENKDNRSLLQNGYNHKMSGNVCYIFEPGFMDHGTTGTTHGSGYNYDTHVPVIFYGTSVKQGSSQQYIAITQIAPTICEFLLINHPNSCLAEPLNDLLR